MQNVTHISADFAISPQITIMLLEQLKSVGFTTVICNRPDHEEAGQPTFAEIKVAVEAAGLETYHIPIRPGQATDADVVAFDHAVTTAKGKVLAYCKSGARAQSLYSARRR